MTEIYLHIAARMADYMATHPYFVARGHVIDVVCDHITVYYVQYTTDMCYYT